MPLGNFFQRYLFNGFGAITFIVPSTRAHMRYARWLLSNTPHLISRVVLSHARFWPRRPADPITAPVSVSGYPEVPLLAARIRLRPSRRTVGRYRILRR